MGGVYSSTAATAAFLSTAFISLAPNVIFLFLPRDQTHPAPKTTTTTTTAAWLTLGQALAAGGLLGDVFLHTLAHATSDEATGVWILLGFCFFLTTDLGIRALEGRHHHKDNDDDDDEDRAHHNNNNNTATVQRPTIVLNLVADAMHNFTDGLAIGASYASSATAVAAATATAAPTVWSLLSRRGGWATLSILCHEVPHELGDVCTLVRAGYTTRQAMLAQLGTALAAFLGTAVALAVSSSSSSGGGDHHGKGDDEWAQDRLVWVTAGGFVYLGATTILPEVLEQRQGGTVRFRMAQWMAFMTGILCLYAVAVLEEGGHDHHHHHHNDHGTTHGHSHGHGHHHHHHHSHATATDEL